MRALGTHQTAETLRLRYDLLWEPLIPFCLSPERAALLRRVEGFSDIIRGAKPFAEESRGWKRSIAAVANGDAAEAAATRQRLDALSVEHAACPADRHGR